MKIKKVKNLKTNVIYGLIYRIISLFFPFLIRTVMINTLSSEYLGLSGLFSSILQALNLFELGIGSALVFNMYGSIATNDKDKLCALYNYYKKCYRTIGTIIFTIGILLLPFLPHLIKGSYPENINLYIIYMIYLLNTVLTYWLYAYKNSIALAHQRTDIEYKVLIVNQIIMYIIQILLLIIFKNYYFYIIVLPIFTVFKNIMVSKKIDKEYKNIKPYGNISDEEKDKVLKNIKSLFGHQIAFTVINSADSIVISSFLGLNELAIYNNYYYIFSAIINLLAILFTSIQAGIGNDILTSSSENIFLNFKRFRFFVYTLVSICSMCLFTLYQPFMHLWMGKDMMLLNWEVIFFVIGFYITQTRKVITTYKNAAGMWKEDFWKPYFVIIVDIIFDILLINKIGSIGAMISTIISMGLVAVPWEVHVLYNKLFKIKEKEYYYFLIKSISLFVLNILLLHFAMKCISFPQIIIEIIVKFAITLLISLTIYCIFNVKNDEFKWLIKRAKELKKNKE